MSAIARVLYERGDIVSGSDRAASAYSEALERLGIRVVYGHFPANVVGADLVLASSAISDANPELAAARELGIPVVRRTEFLGELTAGYRTTAIAGTHGKTTTTALIAWILESAGKSPSFIVGGIIQNLGINARTGSGEDFVIEADEYDHAFFGLHPDLAIVTNVEHDHPDCYPTPESFQDAFQRFASQVREHLIVCLDSPGAASLEHPGVTRTTYGWNPDADWRPEKISPNEMGGLTFIAQNMGRSVGRIRSQLPGEHNALNILAAIAAAFYLDVPFDVIQRAVEDFRGTGRRFETMGVAAGIAVIDDYAHHPTEVRATLAAARQRFPRGKIWAVFQPHTYSRTRTLLATLAQSFKDADHVLITEVFAAREQLDLTISGKMLSEVIEHEDVSFAADFDEAADRLVRDARSGDAIIIMSAGDANQIGRMVLDRLARMPGGKR